MTTYSNLADLTRLDLRKTQRANLVRASTEIIFKYFKIFCNIFGDFGVFICRTFDIAGSNITPEVPWGASSSRPRS